MGMGYVRVHVHVSRLVPSQCLDLIQCVALRLLMTDIDIALLVIVIDVPIGIVFVEGLLVFVFVAFQKVTRHVDVVT